MPNPIITTANDELLKEKYNFTDEDLIVIKKNPSDVYTKLLSEDGEVNYQGYSYLKKLSSANSGSLSKLSTDSKKNVTETGIDGHNPYNDFMSTDRKKNRTKDLVRIIKEKYPSATKEFVAAYIARVNQESLGDADLLEGAWSGDRILNNPDNKLEYIKSIRSNVLHGTFGTLTDTQKQSAKDSLPAALKTKFEAFLVNPIVQGSSGLTGALNDNEVQTVLSHFNGVTEGDSTIGKMLVDEYDGAGSNAKKLNYMYYGDKDSATQGGASGVLQSTLSNYGGLESVVTKYNNISTDLGYSDYKDLMTNGSYDDKVNFSLENNRKRWEVKNPTKETADYLTDIDSFQSMSSIVNPGEAGNTQYGKHDKGYWNQSYIDSIGDEIDALTPETEPAVTEESPTPETPVDLLDTNVESSGAKVVAGASEYFAGPTVQNAEAIDPFKQVLFIQNQANQNSLAQGGEIDPPPSDQYNPYQGEIRNTPDYGPVEQMMHNASKSEFFRNPYVRVTPLMALKHGMDSFLQPSFSSDELTATASMLGEGIPVLDQVLDVYDVMSDPSGYSGFDSASSSEAFYDKLAEKQTNQKAQGGEIGQGTQSPVASQPIANSGAFKAKKILKDFEGLNSTIDKETRDELLKRIYDEQEAKKAQSQSQDPNVLGGGGVAAGGAGGVVDAVGSGVGMLSDLFGSIQDLKGGAGSGDTARAIGSTAKTAGSLVGGAIDVPDGAKAINELEGNRWSTPKKTDASIPGGSGSSDGNNGAGTGITATNDPIPEELKDLGETGLNPMFTGYTPTNTGANQGRSNIPEFEDPNATLGNGFAAGGNMGMFLKAGAGLAQGFNDLGAVGKQYNAQQVGETAGYETLNLDPIKNNINQQMGASRYRAESGATNWGDMLQVNNAISAQGTRQLNDAAIQKQQYDMAAKADYNARKRADLIQQNAYDATAEMQTDKAGAIADDQNRGALNQMLNVGSGVGQDIINKGLAEDIGKSADKEATAIAMAKLFGKAEGGQISGDSDVIQGMKEKGYSDQLINRILNQ